MSSDTYPGDYSGLEAYNDLHHYPVGARDRDASTGGMEGAHKRFVPFPDVQSVRKIACFGLQRLSPEGYAEITDELIEYHLTAACSELELQHSLLLSPTECYQSVDYIEGMFTQNFCGVPLPVWPATHILDISLKYSHTMNSTPVQQVFIPPSWVALYRNKVNVIADFGAIHVTRNASDGTGPMATILGYLRGPYRPLCLEIRYRAGFEVDKMPACLAAWITTLASIRLLSEIGPILFPYSSVAVGIDSVSQTASLPGPMFLLRRIEQLNLTEKKQRNAVKAHFGRNINLVFVGA